MAGYPNGSDVMFNFSGEHRRGRIHGYDSGLYLIGFMDGEEELLGWMRAEEIIGPAESVDVRRRRISNRTLSPNLKGGSRRKRRRQRKIRMTRNHRL